MGKRGPAPKSTQQKELERNPGHRSIDYETPEFIQGAEMSREVKSDPLARAEWQYRAKELIDKKILTKQDQTEFNEYCLQHSVCVNLWKKQKQIGIELAIAKGIYKARLGAVATRARLAAKFGFTPSDRTQLKLPREKAKPAGVLRLLTPNK